MNGPTPESGPQKPAEPAPLTAGSTATTITATTPPSAAHPSDESPTWPGRTSRQHSHRIFEDARYRTPGAIRRDRRLYGMPRQPAHRGFRTRKSDIAPGPSGFARIHVDDASPV